MSRLVLSAGVVLASRSLDPAIATASSRVMYQIDQQWTEQNRELLMGDRRLEYVLLKMRFNEDLLVSNCPDASSFGCTNGSCGCLTCPDGFYLHFKPLQGGATCASSSPFFDRETAPSPALIAADSVCEGGAASINDAVSAWMGKSEGETVFPFRMPGVSCPNFPHLEVFPMLSVWDEPVYLLLKMQSVCMRGRDGTECAEIRDKISRSSNSRVINLAVITRVQTTDGQGSSNIGPTLEEFVNQCEIVPNVFGAKSGQLAASFAASDKQKLKIRPPVCDKKLFDSVASLIQTSIAATTYTNPANAAISCVDESNYPAQPTPNPCEDGREGGACPEVWDGMGCQQLRSVTDNKMLSLLDQTMLWTSLDAFSGCVSLADSLVTWTKTQDATTTTTILSDRCAWQSWEPQFFTDPCCNQGLGSCCRDTEREVATVSRAMAVDTGRVGEVCAADTSGQALFVKKAIAAVTRYQKTSEETSAVCTEQLEELKNVKTDMVSQCRQWLQGNVTAVTAAERIAKTEECVTKILGPELGAQVVSLFDGDRAGTSVSTMSSRCEGDEVWRLSDGTTAMTQARCEEKRRCNWNPFLDDITCIESRGSDFDHFCRKNDKDFTGRSKGEEISVQPGCSVDLYAVDSTSVQLCEMARMEQDRQWQDMAVQQQYNNDWLAFQQGYVQTFMDCMSEICIAQGGSGWTSEGGGFSGRCRDTTKATQEDCEAAADAGRSWIQGVFATEEECEAEVCSIDESITDATQCTEQGFGCDRPCMKCVGSKQSVCVDETVESADVCKMDRSGAWECSPDGKCVCVFDKDEATCGVTNSAEQFLTCDKYTKENECWKNPWNFVLHCQMNAAKCASQEECEGQGQCSDSWFMQTETGCLMDREKEPYNMWGFCNRRLSNTIDEIFIDQDTDSFFSTRDWRMQETGTPLGCSLQAADPSQPEIMQMRAEMQKSPPVEGGDFTPAAPFLSTIGFKMPKSTCSSCGCRDCVKGQSDSAVQQCMFKWMKGSFSSCKTDVALCIPEYFAQLGMYDEKFSSNVMCDQKCSAQVADCMIKAVEVNCKDCDASCRPSPCFNADGSIKVDDGECKRVVNTAFFVNRNGTLDKPAICTAEAWKADCVACGGGLDCKPAQEGGQDKQKILNAQCLRCSADYVSANPTADLDMADPTALNTPACNACVAGLKDASLGELLADRKRPIIGMDGLINDSTVSRNVTVSSSCKPVLAVAQACDVNGLLTSATAPLLTRVGSICGDSIDEVKISTGIKQDIVACVAAATAAGQKSLPSSRTIDTCADPATATSLPRQLAKLLFARKETICADWVPVTPPSADDSGLSSVLVMQWINDDMLAKAQASDVCKTKTKTLMSECTNAKLTVGDLCDVSADEAAAVTWKLADELKQCNVNTLCAKAIVSQVATVFLSDRVFFCQGKPVTTKLEAATPSSSRRSGVVAAPQVRSKPSRWLGLSSQPVAGRKLAEMTDDPIKLPVDPIPENLEVAPQLPAWKLLFSSERFARSLKDAVAAVDDTTCAEPEQVRAFFEDEVCLQRSVLSLDILSMQCAVLQRLAFESQIEGAADELLLVAGCPATSELPEQTSEAAPAETRSQMVAAVWRELQSEVANVAAAWKTTVSASLAECQPESACLDKYAEQIVAVVSQTVTRETVTLADYVRWSLQMPTEPWNQDAVDKTLTEDRCASLGGRWYVKAQSKEECVSGKGSSCCRKTPMADGSCPWGFYDAETEETCGTCKSRDATMTPNLRWLNGGVWQQGGKMVKRGEWMVRGYEPVNRWVTDAINWDKLAVAFETALAEKTAQTYQDYARCRLSVVTSALSDVAGFCGVENVDFLTVSASTAKQDVPKTKMAERTVAPGVASTVGSTRTNLRVGADAFSQSAVVEMSVSDVEEFKAGAFSQAVVGRRLQTVMESTASCYTVVTNADNILVGQLVGSCVNLSATQQTSETGSLTLCLPIDAEIPVSADFAVTDFAEYDATAKKFTPIATSVVTSSSSQQCQTISKLGMYCPIKRVESWTTATVSADASCDALDAVLAEIHSTQKDLGFVTTDYVIVSEQDAASGASFDANVQAARVQALSLDFESVNDPTDVSSGDIQVTTDDDLNKEYGLTLDPVDDPDSPGDGEEEDGDDDTGKSAAHGNGAQLAVVATLTAACVLL